MYEPYQVAEARAWGADCILIIMAARRRRDGAASSKTPPSRSAWTCWSKSTTRTSSSARCKLDVAADRHQQPRPARPSRPRSRPASGWRRRCPPDRIIVGESGIFTPADLARLARVGISTFLVGESLMRQADVDGGDARAARARAAAARPRSNDGRWPNASPISASAARRAWSTSRQSRRPSASRSPKAAS